MTCSHGAKPCETGSHCLFLPFFSLTLPPKRDHYSCTRHVHQSVETPLLQISPCRFIPRKNPADGETKLSERAYAFSSSLSPASYYLRPRVLLFCPVFRGGLTLFKISAIFSGDFFGSFVTFSSYGGRAAVPSFSARRLCSLTL